MSSMLSAPAHIPAIRVVSFGAGFAAPDFTREVVIDTFSASRSASPVCSDSVITGTSPAHETSVSSSKIAEPSTNLWDDRTGSAFLELVRFLCRNSNHPSSRGTFVSSTPHQAASQSVDSGLAN